MSSSNTKRQSHIYADGTVNHFTPLALELEAKGTTDGDVPCLEGRTPELKQPVYEGGVEEAIISEDGKFWN